MAFAPNPRLTTPRRRVLVGVCAVIVLACIVIYGQTLTHGFVKCDDDICVTDNYRVQAGWSWANVVWAFTQDLTTYLMPVTWMSHMTDCQVYGLRPWGHHLTSLILHTVNSILLFLLFARMTRSLWPSALVAVLFAVHPLHVETVAWIADRKGLLSMLFWVAALGAYAWYRRRPNPARYLSVALMFLLGLLSKPTVLPLPFVLLLLDYWPLDQMNRTDMSRGMARRTVWFAVEKLPLLLLTALFSVVTFMLTATHSGNLEVGEKVPLVARCANAAVVYVLYLVKTVWPTGLAVFYPHPITRPVWQVTGAVVILAAITLFSLRHARRRPYLIVGWLWYVGTLVPVIGLVQSGEFSHADRYTYIPLIGIFIMIAWGGGDFIAAWRVPNSAVAVASGAVLVLLTVCSGVQTSYWHDDRTLFSRALAMGQESSFAFNNLGLLALEQGRHDEARTLLTKALDLNPKDVKVLNNLGKLALDQGRYDEAGTFLKRAMDVSAGYPSTLINLGTLAMAQRRYDEALSWQMKAFEAEPRDTKNLNNLGLLALYQRRYDEAKSWLMKSLEVNPTNPSALNNLGLLALEQQHYDEAKPWLTKALDADPENVEALNNMGLLAMNQGNYDEAKPWLTKALNLNPGHLNALNNMGWCLMNQGKYEEAQRPFRKALDIDPQFARAMVNLGNTLIKLGRQEEGNGYLKKAAELNQSLTAGGKE